MAATGSSMYTELRQISHNGIKRIDKGFQNFKEINTVYYDSSAITIEEMEEALKKSGTYLETVK